MKIQQYIRHYFGLFSGILKTYLFIYFVISNIKDHLTIRVQLDNKMDKNILSNI